MKWTRCPLVKISGLNTFSKIQMGNGRISPQQHQKKMVQPAIIWFSLCVISIKSKWYGGFSYVDLLVKGVTEKFIDITFTGYKNSVGDDFGKTIPGVFSDEPNTNTDIGETIRWSPDLASWFKKLHGYDLESNMISMIEETGNWMKLRHDYYATILDMFIKRWSIPMSSYCKKNNLIMDRALLGTWLAKPSRGT